MKKIVCFIIVSFSLIYLGWHSENLRITNLDKTVKITVEIDYHKFSVHDVHLQNSVITDGDVIKQIVNSFKNVRFRKPINYRCEPYATKYELTFWDDNNQLIAGIGIVKNDTIEYWTGHGRRLYYVTKGQIDYALIESFFDPIPKPKALVYDEDTYLPEHSEDV